MSFSNDVKNEILSVERQECCKLSLAYGLLLFGRSFSSSSLSFLTENREAALAYCEAVTLLSGEKTEPAVTDGGNYKVDVTSKKTIEACLEKNGSNDRIVRRRINFANFHDSCCFASFTAGAFLASGTVTDPEKEYHLEFSSSSRQLCADLIKLFQEFDIVPGFTARGSGFIVYIKNSSEIEDILALMGATENSMSLMGTKMFKDVRNKVNRRVNFENANIKRSAAAASKQYDAIRELKNSGRYDKLPQELKQVGDIRWENIEMSTSEIAKAVPGGLSVSGAGHRLKKLISLAEELKKQ